MHPPQPRLRRRLRGDGAHAVAPLRARAVADRAPARAVRRGLRAVCRGVRATSSRALPGLRRDVRAHRGRVPAGAHRAAPGGCMSRKSRRFRRALVLLNLMASGYNVAVAWAMRIIEAPLGSRVMLAVPPALLATGLAFAI